MITFILILLVIVLWREMYLLEKRLNVLEKQLQKSDKTGLDKISPEIVDETLARYADTIPAPEATQSPIATSRALPKSALTKIFSSEPSEPEPRSAQQQPLPPNPLIEWIKNRIFTGNPIANIGVVVLFVGIAFLLRYTAHYNLIPVTVRLVGIAIAGMIMLVGGLLLKGKRELFGTILAGGGIGVLYLTVYTAFQFYHLIPPMPAFVLLFCIVLVSGIAAMVKNAKLLAVLGIIGGFLAPVLISTGSNDYVMLFSYYALLNFFILVMAWFKSWRELNLAGLIFTFSVSALWGWQAYQEAYRWTTESFLIYFFLFYVLVALVTTLRQPRESKGLVNTLLVFGTPVAAFSLQIGLVESIPYALAWSALLLGVFYAVMATITRLVHSSVAVLSIPFATLSLLFLTLAIPLAFSSLWTSAAWALESVAVLWYGVHRQVIRIRLFAACVYIGSLVFFCNDYLTRVPASQFLNEWYLSACLISLAAIVNAYGLYLVKSLRQAVQNELYELGRNIETALSALFFLVGVFGWYAVNFHQIDLYVAAQYETVAQLMLVTGTSLLAWIASEWLRWPWLRYTAMLLLPALIGFSFLDDSNFVASLASLVVWYAILYRHDRYKESYLTLSHFFTLLYLTGLFTYYCAKAIPPVQNREQWVFLIDGYLPALIIYLLCYVDKWLSWPINTYRVAYQQYGGGTLTFYAIIWLAISNFYPGDLSSLIYIPLFNPLDIGIIFVLGSVMAWRQSAHAWLTSVSGEESSRQLMGLLWVLMFCWLNAMLYRTLHYWLSIPYDFFHMWSSMTVQACSSVLWAVIALIATFVASRIKDRTLWFTGFTLIIVVIAKLLLVDLSNTNSLQQISTFIGVGILFLVNGFISPLPPKR